MYKVAVMGDRDSIYGFGALGLDIYPIDDNTGAAKKLRNLSENGYAVIYMTEALCEVLKEELDEMAQKAIPAIIPIPGVSGNTGLGIRRAKKSVEQAVGSDIIFGND